MKSTSRTITSKLHGIVLLPTKSQTADLQNSGRAAHTQGREFTSAAPSVSRNGCKIASLEVNVLN